MVPELLSQWLGQALSAHTRRSHLTALEQLSKYLKMDLQQTAVWLCNASKQEVQLGISGWRGNMAGKRLRAETINNRMYSIRAFLAMAASIGATTNSMDVRRISPKPFQCSPGDAIRIVTCMVASTMNLREPWRSRNLAMVLVAFCFGLRRTEIAEASMHLEDGCLRTGNRLLMLPKPVLEAVQEWLRNRPACSSNKLFVGVDNFHESSDLSPTSISRLFRGMVPFTFGKTDTARVRMLAINAAIDICRDLKLVRKFKDGETTNLPEQLATAITGGR